ncbi:unnamed protein product [Symbiodinium sp. CCMP2592]|nr:unnamed protein product [Symbiodinium sp. CCMP2592]
MARRRHGHSRQRPEDEDSESRAELASGSQYAAASASANRGRPRTVFTMTAGEPDETADRLLRQELPPDAFMALASRMGRAYARRAETPALPASHEDSGEAEEDDPHHRTWPVGARQGTLFAADSVSSSVLAVGHAEPNTVAHRPHDQGEPRLQPKAKKRPLSLVQLDNQHHTARTQSRHQMPDGRCQPPPLVTPEEDREIEACRDQIPTVIDINSGDEEGPPDGPRTSADTAQGSSVNSSLAAPSTPLFLESQIILQVAVKHQAQALSSRSARDASADGEETPPEAFTLTQAQRVVCDRYDMVYDDQMYTAAAPAAPVLHRPAYSH